MHPMHVEHPFGTINSCKCIEATVEVPIPMSGRGGLHVTASILSTILYIASTAGLDWWTLHLSNTLTVDSLSLSSTCVFQLTPNGYGYYNTSTPTYESGRVHYNNLQYAYNSITTINEDALNCSTNATLTLTLLIVAALLCSVPSVLCTNTNGKQWLVVLGMFSSGVSGALALVLFMLYNPCVIKVKGLASGSIGT